MPQLLHTLPKMHTPQRKPDKCLKTINVTFTNLYLFQVNDAELHGTSDAGTEHWSRRITGFDQSENAASWQERHNLFQSPCGYICYYLGSQYTTICEQAQKQKHTSGKKEDHWKQLNGAGNAL